MKITVRKVVEPTECKNPDGTFINREDSETELEVSLDEIIKVAMALDESNRLIKNLIGEEVDLLSWFRSQIPFWPF